MSFEENDAYDARQDFLEVMSIGMAAPCYMPLPGLFLEKLEGKILRQRPENSPAEDSFDRLLTAGANGSGMRLRILAVSETIRDVAGGVWSSLSAWRMPAGPGSRAPVA